MKIQLDQLGETPVSHAFRAGEGWWAQHMPLGDAAIELPSPLEIEVDAHQMGEDIFLGGKICGALDLECARCLARYRHPFQESFQLVAEPAGMRVPADPETAEALARDGLCFGDELSVGWYQGGEIRLDALCFEVISLALPVKPLCREDCAGLCPRCGAVLDEGACGCEQTPSSSPFAALAALRGSTREGEGVD